MSEKIPEIVDGSCSADLKDEQATAEKAWIGGAMIRSDFYRGTNPPAEDNLRFGIHPEGAVGESGS